jgi:hypothetical protein
MQNEKNKGNGAHGQTRAAGQRRSTRRCTTQPEHHPEPPRRSSAASSSNASGASPPVFEVRPARPLFTSRRKTCVRVLVCSVPDQRHHGRAVQRVLPVHRQVSGGGAEERTVLLVDGVDYTWPTTSTIQLVANAVNGDTIEIRRNSLKKVRRHRRPARRLGELGEDHRGQPRQGRPPVLLPRAGGARRGGQRAAARQRRHVRRTRQAHQERREPHARAGCGD